MTASRRVLSARSQLKLGVAMGRPGNLRAAGVPRLKGQTRLWAGIAVLLLVSLSPLHGYAERIPVKDGQEVNLKLVNVLTTDNVQKDDVILFEVSSDVVVNGRVVIAKGAAARGKIVEVKGAYKPRDVNAEVVFQFLSVRAADQQDLPLRKTRQKGAKGKDAEVHEKAAIPGQIMRVVGADKGKEYEAYINGSFTINSPEGVVGEAPGGPLVPPPASPAVASPGLPAAPPPTSPAVVSPTGPAAAPPGARGEVPPVPAVAPPPPVLPDAEETSSVEFASTPDGAEIVIDGKVLGTTHSILHLTPGRHDVEIRLAGYRTWARRMVVDPESHQSLRVTLTPR